MPEGEANKEEETQNIKASPSGDQDDAPKVIGDTAVAGNENAEKELEESDANDGDNGQSSEEGEATTEEANAEANGSEALPSSEVTIGKVLVEPPDSDDQEEEDESNESEAEGEGADGDADADADKDSATKEGLPGSNNDEKGGAETQDNADSEESEGGESSA